MSKPIAVVTFHQAFPALIRDRFKMVVVGVTEQLCTKVRFPAGTHKAVNKAIAEVVEYDKHMVMDRISFRAGPNEDGKPLHEALPDIIAAARSAAELKFIFELMSRAVVPGNQEAIAAAWRQKVHIMQIASPGDVDQLFAHRQLAEVA